MIAPLIVIGDKDDLPLTDLILAYLAERPQTIAQLAWRCGLPRRDVETTLQTIATDGRYGLVADGRGVRLTTDPEAIAAYVGSLRRRMAAIYRRVRAQRQVERRLRGVHQLELAL